MNYIIMFREATDGSLEVQKIPRDDGRGMPQRLSSPSATSNFTSLNQFQRRFEERGKPETGHIKASGGVESSRVVGIRTVGGVESSMERGGGLDPASSVLVLLPASLTFQLP